MLQQLGQVKGTQLVRGFLELYLYSFNGVHVLGSWFRSTLDMTLSNPVKENTSWRLLDSPEHLKSPPLLLALFTPPTSIPSPVESKKSTFCKSTTMCTFPSLTCRTISCRSWGPVAISTSPTTWMIVQTPMVECESVNIICIGYGIVNPAAGWVKRRLLSASNSFLLYFLKLNYSIKVHSRLRWGITSSTSLVQAACPKCTDLSLILLIIIAWRNPA